jgi:conserved hypothetical integral membrane protein
MDLIGATTRIVSHVIFIYLVFSCLKALDFKKIFKSNTNYRTIQLFVILLSTALGFLVSNFFMEIISYSKDLFTNI